MKFAGISHEPLSRHQYRRERMSKFEYYIVQALPDLGLPTDRKLLLTRVGDSYQLRDFHSKQLDPKEYKNLIVERFPAFMTFKDLSFVKVFDTWKLRNDDGIPGVEKTAYWYRELRRGERSLTW
jgi:hypothetical protein